MQTTKKILPTDNFLEEDTKFKKELENYLELPEEMQKSTKSGKIKKVKIEAIFRPEKSAMRRNRRNKRIHKKIYSPEEKSKYLEERKEKGKEETQKQKLIENAIIANTKMPKFLGHTKKFAA